MLAKTRLDRFAQVDREFFGAGYKQTQTVQLLRLSLPQISPEESRSREHDGDLILLDQFRDLFCLERVRVGQGAHALDERIEKRHRAAKAVEEGKRRQKEIVFPRIEGD